MDNFALTNMYNDDKTKALVLTDACNRYCNTNVTFSLDEDVDVASSLMDLLDKTTSNIDDLIYHNFSLLSHPNCQTVLKTAAVIYSSSGSNFTANLLGNMLAKLESVDDIVNLSATRNADNSAVPVNYDVPISFDAVVVAHVDADQTGSLLPCFIYASAVNAILNKSVSVTDDLPIKISQSFIVRPVVLVVTAVAVISKFNLPSAVRKVNVSVSSGN